WKHIIGCLSGATAALVGPLPTFVSTVQHHCCHSRHFCKVRANIPPKLVLKRHTRGISPSCRSCCKGHRLCKTSECDKEGRERNRGVRPIIRRGEQVMPLSSLCRSLLSR